MTGGQRVTRHLLGVTSSRLKQVFMTRGDVEQPVVKVPLHSTGAASRLTALLLGRILPVFSLVAPCQPGAASITTRLGATLDFHHGLLGYGRSLTREGGLRP